MRPLLEELLKALVAARGASVCWSPLFRTAPVGGPDGQPNYLNAAVLASTAGAPTPAAAMELLTGLQGLEQRFARRRHEHWGPRSLDLDLLWWGDLVCDDAALQLPHPRLLERSFVLAAPPGVCDTGLQLPTPLAAAGLRAGAAGRHRRRAGATGPEQGLRGAAGLSGGWPAGQSTRAPRGAAGMA